MEHGAALWHNFRMFSAKTLITVMAKYNTNHLDVSGLSSANKLEVGWGTDGSHPAVPGQHEATWQFAHSPECLQFSAVGPGIGGKGAEEKLLLS